MYPHPDLGGAPVFATTHNVSGDATMGDDFTIDNVFVSQSQPNTYTTRALDFRADDLTLQVPATAGTMLIIR